MVFFLHCTEYSALSMMVSPAVFFFLLKQFYKIKELQIFLKAFLKVSIFNAVIYKEMLSWQTFSVSIEAGVKHFCWCFCFIVIGGNNIFSSEVLL